jgi:hypothetical protein
MDRIVCDLTFVYRKGLDDLNKRLLSNPKYIFRIHKRKRKKRGYQWIIWRHKAATTHPGDVKLVEKNGVFWGEIDDRSGGHKLTGSFLSWMMSNADDLIRRLDFRLPPS